MSEAAIVSVPPDSPADEEIPAILAELRDVFENHFDRTWFSLIIDGVPLDLHTMRDIRDVLSLTSVYPGEERLVYQGARELETFCRTVRRFLLPVLKERLGISWLFPARRVKDARQYIVRKFVTFTFPYHLERLRQLTQRLKASLLLHYPFLR